MADDSNGKAHVSSRKFKFIDQTNRSRKAATAYQSVVRSHVMTEVRRLKRSKAEIQRESSIHITAQSRLIQSKPDGASEQEPLSTFDNPLETDSYLAESLPTWLVNSDEWDKVIATHDETRNFQHAFDTQAIPSTDLPYIALEMPISGLDLACAGSSYSDAAAADTNSQERVPICPHSDQIDQSIISPTILGLSRIDPFHALPIPPNRDIYQLVDHCKLADPDLSGAYTRRHSSKYVLK
jgi:hypothetical protein